MIKVLICDDDKSTTQQVENLLLDIKKSHSTDFSIDIQPNGDFLIGNENKYDIAILDIEMGRTSGLKVAEDLKKNNPDVIIMILTSYSDYLDSAMKISVFRYLSKPIDEERFNRNFNEALEHYRSISKQIVVESNGEVSFIKTKDILYIENLKHGSVIVTNNRIYKNTTKPVQWAKTIDQDDRFIQSHRSFLINLQNVVNFDKSVVTFQKGNELLNVACISRRSYNNLKNAFMNFVGGKR